MLCGEPIRRMCVAYEFRGFVYFVAPGHTRRPCHGSRGRLHFIGNVKSPRRQAVGNRQRHLCCEESGQENGEKN